MNLEEKINGEIKTAMLAKEGKRLEALRAIKAEILLLKSSEKGNSEDAENKAMLKMVKQRKEAADIYTSQNRPELAEAELFQASVIESFLPKQIGPEELQEAIKEIIERRLIFIGTLNATYHFHFSINPFFQGEGCGIFHRISLRSLLLYQCNYSVYILVGQC